jgi:cardiolipin synthase
MFFQLSTALTLLHVLLTLGVAARVIMRRPPTGVAAAWLMLVAFLPYVGIVFYLLVGERRIGMRRARRIAELRTTYANLSRNAIDADSTKVDWDKHPPEVCGMNRLGVRLVGVPTVAGSHADFHSSSEEILKAIAADIDAAQHSVLMEFYIWNEGGAANAVLEALIRPAARGVKCRVLVDALGARPWWKGKQPQRLHAAGVQLQPALPVGLLQVLVGRNDLRLHRKIVVVDGRVAWTGSMNLVDPRFFKQEAHVGQWVDAMVRLQGAAVVPLAMTMIGDWMIETAESVEVVLRSMPLREVANQGTEDVQVIPSGPGEGADGLLQMLLALIGTARQELVLTTPYFVPDESLLRALRGAAARGVRVHMILPEKVDSLLTRYASRSYYSDLLDAGVHIHLYRNGLLHTKSITADQRISMFGTVNLDMRSLWLNYEVALFVYGTAFAEQLRALQQTYIDASECLDAEAWAKRPARQRFIENTLRLVSPVL